MTYGLFVPLPGVEPAFPALEGKFSTTGPPGKSTFPLWLSEVWYPFHSFLHCDHSSILLISQTSINFSIHFYFEDFWNLTSSASLESLIINRALCICSTQYDLFFPREKEVLRFVIYCLQFVA